MNSTLLMAIGNTIKDKGATYFSAYLNDSEIRMRYMGASTYWLRLYIPISDEPDALKLPVAVSVSYDNNKLSIGNFQNLSYTEWDLLSAKILPFIANTPLNNFEKFSE